MTGNCEKCKSDRIRYIGKNNMTLSQQPFWFGKSKEWEIPEDCWVCDNCYWRWAIQGKARLITQ